MRGGIHITKFGNGIMKLIHLRNVSSIALEKTTLTFYYNFPCISGDTYYEKYESKPAFEKIVYPTEEVAQNEFHKARQSFELL
jgi:hypothetical protein